MTKILFDIQRDNGYGLMSYLPGRVSWNPSNRGKATSPKVGISVELGGPVIIDVAPTDDSFWWDVTEYIEPGFGSSSFYKRSVIVPISDDVVNFMELRDVDFNIPYEGQNSVTVPVDGQTVEESTMELPTAEQATAATLADETVG